jgi:hypothetical protein
LRLGKHPIVHFCNRYSKAAFAEKLSFLTWAHELTESSKKLGIAVILESRKNRTGDKDPCQAAMPLIEIRPCSSNPETMSCIRTSGCHL